MTHYCRSCGSKDMEQVFDLGNQPWCNDFLEKEKLGKENKYPLNLVACKECDLLQLDYTVPKEVMFGDHQYLSGMTKTLLEHFKNVADDVLQTLKTKNVNLVVDIGGNDGSQLLQYADLGLDKDKLINVEPATRVAAYAKDKGIPTIEEFFNESCALTNFSQRSVDVINASGVFFHLEELHSAIRGIKHMLADDGIFVVQFMYAGAMVEGKNFDTIYHEHLCYYTLKSLENLLRPYGLRVFDAYECDIHSGSIVAKICHGYTAYEESSRCQSLREKDEKYTIETFKELAKFVEERKVVLGSLLAYLKLDDARIYAYGAPAKGNTLLNYFGINANLVDKAVEVNELKIGNYLPGSYIPIVKESKDDLPDYYLLLSHNFAKEILEKNRDIIEKGVKFILPFPEVKIVGKEYFNE